MLFLCCLCAPWTETNCQWPWNGWAKMGKLKWVAKSVEAFRARGPLNSPKASAFRQPSISFSCYPFSLTRFGPLKLDIRGCGVSGCGASKYQFQNPSPVSVLGVKSPHLQFLRVNKRSFSNPAWVGLSETLRHLHAIGARYHFQTPHPQTPHPWTPEPRGTARRGAVNPQGRNRQDKSCWPEVLWKNPRRPGDSTPQDSESAWVRSFKIQILGLWIDRISDLVLWTLFVYWSLSWILGLWINRTSPLGVPPCSLRSAARLGRSWAGRTAER